jgi:hypothetical protein
MPERPKIVADKLKNFKLKKIKPCNGSRELKRRMRGKSRGVRHFKEDEWPLYSMSLRTQLTINYE